MNCWAVTLMVCKICTFSLLKSATWAVGSSRSFCFLILELLADFDSILFLFLWSITCSKSPSEPDFWEFPLEDAIHSSNPDNQTQKIKRKKSKDDFFIYTSGRTQDPDCKICWFFFFTQCEIFWPTTRSKRNILTENVGQKIGHICILTGIFGQNIGQMKFWPTLTRSQFRSKYFDGSVKIKFRPPFFWPSAIGQNIGQNKNFRSKFSVFSVKNSVKIHSFFCSVGNSVSSSV